MLDRLDRVTANVRRFVRSHDKQFKEVAAKAGIDEARFYALMDGRGRFEIEEYAGVCRALDVPMEFFLDPNS